MSLPFIELEKFNIIEISKEIRISKETARKKILELQRDGIISRDKKKITVNFRNINKLVDSNLTIQSF